METDDDTSQTALRLSSPEQITTRRYLNCCALTPTNRLPIEMKVLGKIPLGFKMVLFRLNNNRDASSRSQEKRFCVAAYHP